MVSFRSAVVVALVASTSAIYDPNAPPMPEGGVGMMKMTNMVALPTAQKTATTFKFNSELIGTSRGCTGYPLERYQQCPFGYDVCGEASEDNDQELTKCGWLQNTIKCCPNNDASATAPLPDGNMYSFDGCTIAPAADYQTCEVGYHSCGTTNEGAAGCPWFAQRLVCCKDKDEAPPVPPSVAPTVDFKLNSVLIGTALGCTGYPVAQYQQCPYGYATCQGEGNTVEDESTGCPWLQATLKCCADDSAAALTGNFEYSNSGCSIAPAGDHQVCGADQCACGETEDGEGGCAWLARRLKCCAATSAECSAAPPVPTEAPVAVTTAATATMDFKLNSVLIGTALGCTGYPVAQYQQCPYGYATCQGEGNTVEDESTGCPWLQATLKCCADDSAAALTGNFEYSNSGCSIAPAGDHQVCGADQCACGETEDGEGGCAWLARRLKCCAATSAECTITEAPATTAVTTAAAPTETPTTAPATTEPALVEPETHASDIVKSFMQVGEYINGQDVQVERLLAKNREQDVKIDSNKDSIDELENVYRSQKMPMGADSELEDEMGVEGSSDDDHSDTTAALFMSVSFVVLLVAVVVLILAVKQQQRGAALEHGRENVEASGGLDWDDATVDGAVHGRYSTPHAGWQSREFVSRVRFLSNNCVFM